MKRLRDIILGWYYGTPSDRRHEIEVRAKDIFQIVEYEHLIWITYNGSLFCPYHLINKEGTIDDCVSFVNTLRSLYVDRVAKEEGIDEPGQQYNININS